MVNEGGFGGALVIQNVVPHAITALQVELGRLGADQFSKPSQLPSDPRSLDRGSVMTNAEQTIADLRVALPAAETELAAAKKAEASARHELARFEAGCLARERVKVAARIDALIADFSAAFARWYERFRCIYYPSHDWSSKGTAARKGSITGPPDYRKSF
jgi:hypothetical protein